MIPRAKRRGLILAGDVGGTKVNLALVEPAAGGDAALAGSGGPGGFGGRIVAEERFESEDFGSLEAVVEAFLAGASAGQVVGAATGGRRPVIERACLGLACPVVDGVCRMVNLPWLLSLRDLADALGIPEVVFLNDLEATAYGLEVLGEEGFATLHAGRSEGPTAALIAAGTGLGAAILTHVNGRSHVLPTEAGHADFAPRDDFEVALLETLRGRYGRVSVERVVSGPGILDLYRFLRDTGREEEPDWLAERLETAQDPPAEISAAGLAGEAPICEAALDRFVAAYGAAAGNLALATLALAGVYVGGGIAPAILPALRGEAFTDAFRAKGRLSGLIADVPIRVVLEPRAALLGAARYALMA
ncbi:MAG TPA: glucokinase [Gemmatimonadota bacterium]|nr:glucokinase [Gemmatimonadota bacterium]